MYQFINELNQGDMLHHIQPKIINFYSSSLSHALSKLSQQKESLHSFVFGLGKRQALKLVILRLTNSLTIPTHIKHNL